jgi:hypothetical protein
VYFNYTCIDVQYLVFQCLNLRHCVAWIMIRIIRRKISRKDRQLVNNIIFRFLTGQRDGVGGDSPFSKEIRHYCLILRKCSTSLCLSFFISFCQLLFFFVTVIIAIFILIMNHSCHSSFILISIQY